MLQINFKVALVLASALLTGCASTKEHYIHSSPKKILMGPQVTNNGTPLDQSFQCMEGKIRESGNIGLSVSVGNVKDYTGKFSESDGGNPITQGGSLMVTSALGKLSGVLNLRERFDTQVAEIELAYMNKQYLGDGEIHRINDPRSQQIKEVRWLPYRGGTILKSDYYIVGGITELNYNIQSSGAEFSVAGSGIKGRTFAVNVAVDLRIVNTNTLNVEKSISLQKQLVGHEVGASVFRFFGDRLVDFNAGSKRQEPLQLGVRTTLEMGVLELIGHVAGVSPVDCIDSYINPPKEVSTSEFNSHAIRPRA